MGLQLLMRNKVAHGFTTFLAFYFLAKQDLSHSILSLYGMRIIIILFHMGFRCEARLSIISLQCEARFKIIRFHKSF